MRCGRRILIINVSRRVSFYVYLNNTLLLNNLFIFVYCCGSRWSTFYFLGVRDVLRSFSCGYWLLQNCTQGLCPLRGFRLKLTRLELTSTHYRGNTGVSSSSSSSDEKARRRSCRLENERSFTPPTVS